MPININVTISGTIGLGAGPFDIYHTPISPSNDGILVTSGVSRATLLSPGQVITVPDGTTTIRVRSTGSCTDYDDAIIPCVTTPTPTATLIPPTATPASPTATPGPTATPAPTATPGPTASPTPTGTPSPTATSTPTPTATESEPYITLYASTDFGQACLGAGGSGQAIPTYTYSGGTGLCDCTSVFGPNISLLSTGITYNVSDGTNYRPFIKNTFSPTLTAIGACSSCPTPSPTPTATSIPPQNYMYQITPCDGSGTFTGVTDNLLTAGNYYASGPGPSYSCYYIDTYIGLTYDPVDTVIAGAAIEGCGNSGCINL